MTQQHFIWFAKYIRDSGLSTEDKHKLATMVIAGATNFNDRFRTDKFLTACGLEPRS